jgi:hypothetical protein
MHLSRGEEDEYSGLVSISIAKCHQQQQNTLLEALYYHRAGKFFLNSQKQMAVTGTPTFQVSDGLRKFSLSARQLFRPNLTFRPTLSGIDGTCHGVLYHGNFVVFGTASTRYGRIVVL